MRKRSAMIFIAFICLTTPSANYGRPQTGAKEHSRTRSAAKPAATTKVEPSEGTAANAGPQTNGSISPQSVGGSGYPGTIPVWSTSTALGNSTLRLDLFDNLGINGAPYPNTEVTINAGQDSGLKIISSGMDGVNVKGGTNGVYAESTSFGVVGIGNQERRDGTRRRVCPLHRDREQVVRRALVHESPPRLVHRDHPRLAAVHDEVWKHRLAAVGARADRYRCPE